MSKVRERLEMLANGTGIYDPDKAVSRLRIVRNDVDAKEFVNAIAERAKRERESRHPRYIALLEKALAKTRAK